MIGFLSGEVLYCDGVKILMKLNTGMGYEIYFPKMLAVGKPADLFIAQIVRETSHELFGFESYEEKDVFELLLGVNGVGPKSAFSLLHSLGVKSLVNAILLENKKALQSAPGIGPKAAAQIILSLKDKMEKISPTLTQQSVPLGSTREIKGDENTYLQDVLLACKELGFQESKILTKAQVIINERQIESSEELIKLVLQELR